MSDKDVFEYAVLRAVPRVDRAEFVNVGVLLYCQQRDFLEARTHVDERRLLALDPHVDLPAVGAAIEAIGRICAGEEEVGPAGTTPLGQRFRWLTAPRSTILHPGPVHAGLTDNPAGELSRLFARLVLL